MSPMPRRTRRLASIAFAACLVVAALVAGHDPVPAEPLVFALAVHAEDGRVLASPVVMGDSGQTVEVRLLCEQDPRHERMSLVLDPMTSSEGELSFSFELSVAGRVDRARGTVTLETGSEKRISVRSEGLPEGVTLALYAAPLKHPGVEQYLKDRREKLARPHS